MRAVVLEQFGRPLVVDRAVAAPEPGPDDVVLRVTATGVCGTDVKLCRGDLPNTPLPLVPGHEIAGVVEHSPEGFPALGTPVVVLHHLFCGECERCRSGSENLCARLRGRVGFDHAGGWADLVRVPARNVLRIPDGVPAVEACVIPDAVATVWRAVHTVGRLVAGEGVVVVGAGGLGLSACQIASLRGGRVLAIDVSAVKLAEAARCGAEWTALPRDASEAARALPAGVPSLVLECAGTPDSIALAASLLPPGGRLVVVGYSLGTRLDLTLADVALRELQVLGCRASALDDLRQALAAAGSGLVRPVVGETWPLEEAEAALDELRAGRAVGRPVLVPS
ncbi:MAG: alcohol dehydrogenase [Candidatus Rokuibacteriota bacterium]|nr:MAG: alcohol dehydrogenase [Candidatus Rokubacteria bacterium]